jgi:hypothetical protein
MPFAAVLFPTAVKYLATSPCIRFGMYVDACVCMSLICMVSSSYCHVSCLVTRNCCYVLCYVSCFAMKDCFYVLCLLRMCVFVMHLVFSLQRIVEDPYTHTHTHTHTHTRASVLIFMLSMGISCIKKQAHTHHLTIHHIFQDHRNPATVPGPASCLPARSWSLSVRRPLHSEYHALRSELGLFP